MAEASAPPERKIVTPLRGKNGLFVQTTRVGPDREVEENHHRQAFANHFNFADPYTGNTRTFDELGRYNCGRCNQEDAGGCLLLAIRTVDREAGSCEDWENKCAGDPEMRLREKSIEAAGYAVAKNGIGFGCMRCPYASAAFQPDSRGRDLYCGKGDFRTFGNVCCALNGAEETQDSYEDLAAPADSDGDESAERSALEAEMGDPKSDYWKSETKQMRYRELARPKK